MEDFIANASENIASPHTWLIVLAVLVVFPLIIKLIMWTLSTKEETTEEILNRVSSKE